MTPNDLDRKARELLAAECQKPTSYDEPHIATRHAHTAITAALRLAVPELAGWRLESRGGGVWAVKSGRSVWLDPAPTLADEGES